MTQQELEQFISERIDMFIMAQAPGYESFVRPYLPTLAQYLVEELQRNHLIVKPGGGSSSA